MKDIIVALIFFGSLTACIGFCGYLIYHGKDGWGWLLFVTMLIFGSAKVSVQ